jgi:hypothetical protein
MRPGQTWAQLISSVCSLAVPSLQELAIVLELNEEIYNSTTLFPCGASQLVDEPGICDYALHGLQVRGSMSSLAGGKRGG